MYDPHYDSVHGSAKVGPHFRDGNVTFLANGAKMVNRDTVASRHSKNVVVIPIMKDKPPLRVRRRDRSVGFEMVILPKKGGRARAAAQAWTAGERDLT